MAKSKKENGKYSPINLYFVPTSNRDSRVYHFLSLISRYQTSFIATLVDEFLSKHGYNDVEQIQFLSREDALNLIQELSSPKHSPPVPQAEASSLNTQNGLLMLLQGLLSQNPITNLETVNLQPHTDSLPPVSAQTIPPQSLQKNVTPDSKPIPSEITNPFSHDTLNKTEAAEVEEKDIEEDEADDDDSLLPGWESSMNSFSI